MIAKSEQFFKNTDFLNNYTTVDVLKWAAGENEGKIALSSAFGPECQLLMDLIVKNSIDIHIFSLDTGRLFK